jgi:hypothetical protein
MQKDPRVRMEELRRAATDRLPQPVSEAGGESGQGGCAGVAAVLSGLTAELRHAMTLAGARTVSEITSDLVA